MLIHIPEPTKLQPRSAEAWKRLEQLKKQLKWIDHVIDKHIALLDNTDSCQARDRLERELDEMRLLRFKLLVRVELEELS